MLYQEHISYNDIKPPSEKKVYYTKTEKDDEFVL